MSENHTRRKAGSESHGSYLKNLKDSRVTSLGSDAYVCTDVNSSDRVPLYDSIQEVVDDVNRTTEINVAQGNYFEDVLVTSPFRFFFKGGYDEEFTSNDAGQTVIKGFLAISSGTVEIDGLVIGGQ